MPALHHASLRYHFLIILALLSHCAASARAATIPVTSTADGIDAAASCAGVTLASLPGPNGQTTLREAVCAANNTPGADTITFAVNGSFVLSAPTNEDSNNGGDLDVKQDLAIQGNGAADTIIDGGGIERIFDVLPPVPMMFSLSDLTVRNGDTRTVSFKQGGAMYLDSKVTSTITNCVISNNFAGSNGAIHNIGNLTITGSTISNNQTIPVSGNAVAGGLRNIGALTMDKCTVSNNLVRGEGGGISISLGSAVTATITNTTISGNSAVIVGTSVGSGGGISTTSNQGTINLTNCTISGNRADNNGGGANWSSPAGGTGNVTLTNVTLTNNMADNDNNAAGVGGGFVQSVASVRLQNTIIAGNVNSIASVRDDISGAVAAASASNLIGDGTGSSGIADGMNNNQVGSGASPIDPMLVGLANNGGPTETHALQSGSPAIDRADNATAPAADQRGVTRPIDGDSIPGAVADIGAYEEPMAVLPEIAVEQPAGMNLTDEMSTVAYGTVDYGDNISRTFTVQNTGPGNLTGLGITFDGANPGDFTVIASPTTPVAPSGSTIFTVRFAPAAPGARSAVMHIASNDGDENPFDINLTGNGLTVAETWRQQHFGSPSNTGDGADTNDFDRDGLTNLEERAFGLNPTVRQSNSVAVNGGIITPGQPTFVLMNTMSGLEFSAMYARRKDYVAAGLNYTAQFSDNLPAWMDGVAAPTVIADDGILQVVTVPCPFAVTATGIVRVSVTQN